MDPNAPDGRLMCSTKTNLTTNMHIDGFGYWGLCDDQHCPDIKGIKEFFIEEKKVIFLVHVSHFKSIKTRFI